MKKDMVNTEIQIKDIKSLTKNIENSSNFVKNLGEDDKKLFKNILQRLKDDTNGEFTETEYEGISKMVLFCDKIEEFFNSVGVEQVDTDMLDLYRKMKTQVTMFMKDYRDGKKMTPPSINMIKIQLGKLSDLEAELDDARIINDEDIIIDVEEKPVQETKK